MLDKVTTKVKDIIDNRFITDNVNYVPDVADKKLTFGNKGLKFTASTLFIDLRGSTSLLNSYNRTTVAKVHMSYYHIIVTIAKAFGGDIRSFNGDSLLVFFQGTTKQSINKAVLTAMKMRYALSEYEPIVNKIGKYTNIDFGIGVDYGEVIATKVGIGGTSNVKDVFWIGNPVNRSAKLGDAASLPNAIYASKMVYTNLLDSGKFADGKDFFGNKTKVDMWSHARFKYNGEYEDIYTTNYYVKFS